MRRPAEAGFTLLEALVASALLTMIVFHFLGTRTDAMIDAADARNWRVAREIAAHQLSIIRAGAHEIPPENRQTIELDEAEYPDFSYQVLIGEAAISEAESELTENMGSGEEADRASERLEWQRERDMLRNANAAGMSFTDYEDQIREEELEEKLPSEDELEDVAVIVYFPNLRDRESDTMQQSTFMLKAKISTMAIQGLTPDEAQAVQDAQGGLDGAATSNGLGDAISGGGGSGGGR